MAPKVTTMVNSGGLSQVVESVSFGVVPPQSKSSIVVVDAQFSGFQSIGNLGIGVASSNIPGGPAGVLFFDIFDSPESVTEPTRTFVGIVGNNGAENIEDVGMRSLLSSKYVALMVKAQDRTMDNACVILKWFFGFCKEA